MGHIISNGSTIVRIVYLVIDCCFLFSNPVGRETIEEHQWITFVAPILVTKLDTAVCAYEMDEKSFNLSPYVGWI